MKINKLLTGGSILGLTIIPISIVTSCSPENNSQNQPLNSIEKNGLRVATFNISFAVDNDNMLNGGPDYWERWNNYLSYTKEEQDQLINKWLQNELNSQKPNQSGANVDTDEHLIAERIIQLKNIAAQIQFVRPDVIVLNELNNNGIGTSKILDLFQKNYLSHAQYYDGPDGSKLCEPIEFPFTKEYATNTGELAVDANGNAMDLDNDGKAGKQAENDINDVVIKYTVKNNVKYKLGSIRKGQVYLDLGTYDGPADNNLDGKRMVSFEPDDTFGFGYYHGHYAFGVMSKYEFGTDREFRKFKIKDMPDSQKYRAYVDNRLQPSDTFQDGVSQQIITKGDYWHNDNEWNNFRLSSKNHVDLPVIVNGQTIHLLISHPTPTGFDKVAPNNVLRNRAEIDFWKHYINNNQQLYDDKGKRGGLEPNSKFIVLGDLNADNYIGSDDPSKGDVSDQWFDKTSYNSKIGINNLVNDPQVNPDVIEWDAKHVPYSLGSLEDKNPPNNWNYIHPYPFVKTSVFGSRADWVIPSKTLEVINAGVFWHGKNERAYKLFIDQRLGNNGNSKEVSSDHRLVYVDFKI